MAELPLPYRTIDDYIIQSRLEDGGMSVVYKGYDTHRNQDVVIKVLHDRYVSHADVAERFQREIEIAKELHHTHIVPFYGFGEIDGKPYIAMRYMPGGTLSDAMKRGRVTLADTAKWLLQIGAALDYAHRRGVIHRDIKPGNVLLDAGGDASLTDFGIARVVDASQLTRTDMTMPGTARFMSPEQAVGKSIDSRSDIYSLAVLAFTLVTGDYPFDGPNEVAIIIQHIDKPAPRPSTRRADLPRTLDKVILQSLAKRPEARHQTAGDFAAAFAAAVGYQQAGVDATASPRKEATAPIIASPSPYAGVRRSPGRWFSAVIALGIFGSVAAIIVLGILLLTGLGRGERGEQIIMEVSATPEQPSETPFRTVEPAIVAPPVIGAMSSPTPTAIFNPFPTLTPILPIDAIVGTESPDRLTNTPRPTQTITPTPTTPNDWLSGTRLYVQYEIGISAFVGSDPENPTQFQPGDVVTISQGLVEGDARREWYSIGGQRWWHVIPANGSAGWLPEDALDEERPPPGGRPTATPTLTPTPTITLTDAGA